MEPESQEESQIELEDDRPSSKKSDQPRQKHRRRRRSSARFLRLTGRLMDDIDEDENEEEEVVESEQHLGDMYKRAIRMNAENRINASNSWNLRLIENIDKFLEEDQEESKSSGPSGIANDDDEDIAMDSSNENETGGKSSKAKRVNFTKASCTLDASVKIYSYRVDDVHLSSYKVLANLNRTDNSESSKKTSKQRNEADPTQQTDEDGAPLSDDEMDDEGPARSTKNAATLETNVANINMNKHDSAFDIDPLFHKMSKTFDEGGAKGLLLVNLGVGTKGCNIVFDSKAECQEEEVDGAPDEERKDGMIDISSLLNKLSLIEETQPIESMTLVPQLASLRQQYSDLKEEGFVEANTKSSRRYASTQEEEKEADMSIHQEAIERSRMSQSHLGRSFATQDQDDYGADDSPMFAADDFGGADGGGDDEGFDAFISLNASGDRFSSISFRDSIASAGPNQGNIPQSQADVLLDAICSGTTALRAGEYEFFDTQALATSMSGNLWAGSTHWKRAEPVRRKKEDVATGKKKKVTRQKKTKKKSGPCLDLTNNVVVEDLLRKPPKGKKGSNPLQMSKAMITKYTKESNLLPPDSGIGIEKLAGLFLRPNAVMQPTKAKNNSQPLNSRKSVCFDTAVETFGENNFGGGGHDDSYGDDDGPGFVFADDDPVDDSHDAFVTEELKGVRKVDTRSVQVGYATVAKKVDVRRLKRDLWNGIEAGVVPNKKAENNENEIVDDEFEEHEKSAVALSFQDTVRDMEESKTQVDVTLPFYFICVLHLANEKGLRLESMGLDDFVIHNDGDASIPAV